MSKFKLGDHVCSNSGLTYIVLDIHELDYCGSFAYSVRRLRGGKLYGSTRKIAESSLWPESEGFVYDESKMFPFATSRHRMTD